MYIDNGIFYCFSPSLTSLQILLCRLETSQNATLLKMTLKKSDLILNTCTTHSVAYMQTQSTKGHYASVYMFAHDIMASLQKSDDV